MKNTSNKKPRTRMTLHDVQAAESKTDWQRLNDMPDMAVTLARTWRSFLAVAWPPFDKSSRSLHKSKRCVSALSLKSRLKVLYEFFFAVQHPCSYLYISGASL